MKIHTMVLGTALLAATAGAAGQGPDAAFTASGTSCSEVTWSPETLERYPNIASACQAVLERNGTYYVRFEGDLRRVARRGQELTVEFKGGGDPLKLTPPENLSLYINGKRTSPAELRPGDHLVFYVPQERLAAEFYPAEPTPEPAEEVPISPATPERLAAAPESTMPRTASPVPLIGLVGSILLALGAAMTMRRRADRSS